MQTYLHKTDWKKYQNKVFYFPPIKAKRSNELKISGPYQNYLKGLTFGELIGESREIKAVLNSKSIRDETVQKIKCILNEFKERISKDSPHLKTSLHKLFTSTISDPSYLNKLL